MNIIKLLLLASFTAFFAEATFGQNSDPTPTVTEHLIYKTPYDKNGLTEIGVDLRYKIINKFGTIMVIFEAQCNGNLVYQYKGREWTFTGSESEVRAVKPKDPLIKVLVSGPNGFKREMILWVTSGLGGGAAFGDSQEIKNATTVEEKSASNYTITPIEVVSLSFDNVWDVQRVIEQKLKQEEQSRELERLKNVGDNALSKLNYIEAQSSFQKILKLDPSNSYAAIQLEKIKSELEKINSKEKYDKLMAAAENEERNNNLPTAEKLYTQAAATGVNDSFAQSQAYKVRSLIDNKNKELERQAKAVQDQIDKDVKNETEARKTNESETLKKQKELEEFAEKALKAKMDSLTSELDKAERKRIEVERENYYKQLEEEKQAKEKKENAEEKEENQKRRNYDQERIKKLEAKMSYDPEAYIINLKESQLLLNKAFAINPWSELHLKREWWDNNNYIQYFADDLYENQRQENHKNFLAKNSEARADFYAAKEQLIQTLLFVDKGSREEEHLLNSIEICNVEIDSLEKEWKNEWNGEITRGKNREQARILNEGQIIIDNRAKAELAYAALDSKAAYPAQYLTKKYELAERMNQAHQTYVEELAVAGVSNSVAIDLITSDTSVDGGENYGLLNGYASIGYGQFPLLINETSDNNESKTIIDSFIYADVGFGIDFWIVRLNNIGVNLGGRANLGFLPAEGSSTSIFNYAGILNVDYGFKRVKIINSFEYLTRTGKYEIDYDITSPGVNGPSNRMGEGEFNYSVLRIGAGIKIDLNDDDEASHLILNLFAEKPSFYPENIFSKPIFSYEMEFMAFGGFALSVGYSKNYVVPGKKEYNITESNSSDFFHFTIGKYFTLINPKNL